VIDDGPTSISSLPTQYPLNNAVVLAALYNEVAQFWLSSGITFNTSRFVQDGKEIDDGR